MKRYLATAALLFAGVSPAQTWQQILGDDSPFPTSLAPAPGLATDGHGRVFVQARASSNDGIESSRIYALEQKGQPAWAPSLIERPMTDHTFLSRGLTARNGYRVAWFEIGQSGAMQDVLFLYAPGESSAEILRFPHTANTYVTHASTDGAGGVVIAHVDTAASNRPLVQRLFPDGSVGWSRPIGRCWGADQQPTALHGFDVDFGDGVVISAVSRCIDPGALFHNYYAVQTFDLTTGAVSQALSFNPNLYAEGRVIGTHPVGAGRYVLELANPYTYWHTLIQVSTAGYFGPLPMPPSFRVKSVARHPAGALISAVDPQRNAVGVQNVGLAGGNWAWTEYPELSRLSVQEHTWSADASGLRVVAFTEPDSAGAGMTLLAFNPDTSVAWSRSVDAAVVEGATPQLVAGAASGDIVLAVDAISRDGSIGVHVEQFPLNNPYIALPVRH